ncbi:hypothetical protein KAM348_22860 [Aeromonas caviae]|uniref:Uncharacterized protein n=1 Tax=Aeromonas caviae TaxID=648 RepID=A0AAI9KTJ4_AERCA|nr:hypothetical protein [Aeromonas caviae]MDH1839460.1 hypothetical protein [Aeromonas caviae]GJA54863.1 hypothetical protein KAM348_22860 [Aeromonas caviae]
MAHYLHRNGAENQRTLTFISGATLPFTTLRQLSKISVDNCVQQLAQTLGQLVYAGIRRANILDK